MENVEYTDDTLLEDIESYYSLNMTNSEDERNKKEKEK